MERVRHVSFTGILEIADLNWLSAETVDAIGETLGGRDRNAHPHTNTNALSRPLNLEYVEELKFWFSFSLGLKLKVIIQGEKWMPVSFLQCEQATELGAQLSARESPTSIC